MNITTQNVSLVKRNPISPDGWMYFYFAANCYLTCQRTVLKYISIQKRIAIQKLLREFYCGAVMLMRICNETVGMHKMLQVSNYTSICIVNVQCNQSYLIFSIS